MLPDCCLGGAEDSVDRYSAVPAGLLVQQNRLNIKGETLMLENRELMTRRVLLRGAGLLAVAAATGASLRVSAASGEHDHQHHVHTTDIGLQRVIDHAMDCVKKGEICSQHCIDLVKAGDTTIADCMDTVQQMLASCTAMAKLAAHNSRHLKALMQVCIGICEDCEKECRKHEDKHAECKACANSCADCIKVCKEYIA
jgi:Cys-rich four helix bundle protein (predicted Tat secretion target)